MRTFRKADPAAPDGFFACEAAGLRWLADAASGARCAQVIGYDSSGLTLEFVTSAPPDPTPAREFGARLAQTHNAGAGGFGAPPAGWSGPGFFGPLQQPLPMSYGHHAGWGSFYATERLRPMLEEARPRLDRVTCTDLENVISRCCTGDFDVDDIPARLHGDLWSGNLLWTARDVVLIDPAAHGGHRETDLAMLALFGCPHLGAVLEGYQEVNPLRPGWRERTVLHQLYPLLAHVVLFGGGYASQTARAARACVNLV
ncbi:MAG TPA: fructosamine kinase family protein [Mycobacterium sp.]|nr:fructosamine kinase family protein [Mycobacterium sp.]